MTVDQLADFVFGVATIGFGIGFASIVVIVVYHLKKGKAP